MHIQSSNLFIGLPIVASDFEDVDKGYAATLDRIFDTGDSFVQVGWFEQNEEKNKRRPNSKGKGGNLKNVDIAIKNEFGSGNTPARPFVRSSHDDNLERTSKLIEREYGKIVDGDSDAKTSLGKIGLFVQSYTQRKITTLREPPNAPLTIELKKSSNPLIDTAQMRNSISTKVTIKRRD